jgi:hypothetical protein
VVVVDGVSVDALGAAAGAPRAENPHNAHLDVISFPQTSSNKLNRKILMVEILTFA